MASIAELIDSRQYTRDRNGKEAGTRVFRVLEAQNEAGARDEFSERSGDARITSEEPTDSLARRSLHHLVARFQSHRLRSFRSPTSLGSIARPREIHVHAAA